MSVSRIVKITNLEVLKTLVKTRPNHDVIRIKKSKTERNNTNPILSDELEKMKNRKLLEEYFSHSLEIELLLRLYPDDEDTIYQIVDLLVDTCDSKRKLIRIAGDDKPAEVVLSRLKKLNADHIRFVLDCLAANTSPIRNMKQYLLAALFNAPTTILTTMPKILSGPISAVPSNFQAENASLNNWTALCRMDS